MATKIEYRTPAGSGGYTVLADEGESGDATGPRVRGFVAMPMRAAPQIDELAFSATKSVNDQGNAHWKVSFRIERIHADQGAAATFIKTNLGIFAALAPRANIDLKITQGGTVSTLGKASVIGPKPDPDFDRSTVINYEFEGETYT